MQSTSYSEMNNNYGRDEARTTLETGITLLTYLHTSILQTQKEEGESRTRTGIDEHRSDTC